MDEGKKRELSAETQVLCYMLDRYKETKTDKDRESVLSCLAAASVYVPLYAVNQTSTPARADGKKQFKLTVRLLETKAGRKYFPVFSVPEEAPEQMRKGPGFVSMPYQEAVKMALEGKKADGIAVDAFSHNVQIGLDELTIMQGS